MDHGTWVVQERVREMEAAVEEQEAQITELRGKLGGLETDRQTSLEEKRQLRTHFQTKIASVTSQLGALQRQLRDRASGQVCPSALAAHLLP
jgi:chromosome segregation ATPase